MKSREVPVVEMSMMEPLVILESRRRKEISWSEGKKEGKRSERGK